MHENRLDASRARRALVLSGALLLAAMALLGWLNTKITVYSDDYWYGTFYDGGFKAFLQKMAEHYRTTNGRFYIHLIVPTVLLFDTKLFVFLSPVLLALLYGFGARALNDRLTTDRVLLSAALGIFCTLACDVQYLRMTLLWISAYFNYIFPVGVILLAALYQKRAYAGRLTRAGRVWGGVFALLAGAATEQCAFLALAMLWGFAILSLCGEKKKARRPGRWTYPLLGTLGFLTILAAPGSWARVDRGVGGGILGFLAPDVFPKRFYGAILYLVEYRSTVLLLAALFALAALVSLRDRRFPRALRGGFVLAAGQLVLGIFGLEHAACIWAVAGLLYISIVLLTRRAGRETGLLVLGALLTEFVPIITTLNSERTAFPGIVSLIVAALSLLMRLPPERGRRTDAALACVLTAVCVAAAVPTLRGYAASKKVVDRNLAAIEESRTTGVCYFDIDIDPDYRFSMPFEGDYFYDTFRGYYHFADTTRLVFTSDKWQLGTISDGIMASHFPTLQNADGLLFPSDYTFKAIGGSGGWYIKDQLYEIELDGKKYRITEAGRVSELLPDGSEKLLGTDMPLVLPFSKTYTLTYFSAEKLHEYFGVDWTLDNATGVFTLRRG